MLNHTQLLSYCAYILYECATYRKLNWSQLWTLVAEKDLVTQYSTNLADQDVFNAVVRHNPDLLHRLDCRWNVQLSDNAR